jgi:hypothetical protein
MAESEKLPEDIEGRTAIAIVAAWVAIAATPGSIFSTGLNESQQPITIALGITTVLGLVGIVAHWLVSDAQSRQLARIGLLAAQFGLALAALAVTEFILFPSDAQQQQLALGIGLLLLVGVAFMFTAGIALQAANSTASDRRAARAIAIRRGGVTTNMFLVLSGTLLVAAGAGFVALVNLGKDAFPGLDDVVLLVAGFVTVTLLLYIGSVLLQTLGLGNRREALGMPEGSIRALIAMSLILIFAIIGVSVFKAGSNGTTYSSTDISQQQVDSLARDEVLQIARVSPAPGGEQRFNVTIRASLPTTAKDFGLQLLTTVSTLVVAVSGFYFGSKSVAQATKSVRGGQTASSLDLLTPAGEATLKKAGDPKTWQPVPITLAVSPDFVDLAPTIKGDATGRLDRTGPGAYVYKPGEPGTVVAITFTMPSPYEGSQKVILTTE